MSRSKLVVTVCVLGLGIFMATGRLAHEGLAGSKILVLPENLQSLSLKEFLVQSGRQVDPAEEWRPLSEEELLERKTKLTSKALKYSAELADSLRAPSLSQGLFRTEETLSSYYNLAKRYHFRLKLSYDEATLRYHVDY